MQFIEKKIEGYNVTAQEQVENYSLTADVSIDENKVIKEISGKFKLGEQDAGTFKKSKNEFFINIMFGAQVNDIQTTILTMIEDIESGILDYIDGTELTAEEV